MLEWIDEAVSRLTRDKRIAHLFQSKGKAVRLIRQRQLFVYL
jgi:hypothetical protein